MSHILPEVEKKCKNKSHPRGRNYGSRVDIRAATALSDFVSDALKQRGDGPAPCGCDNPLCGAKSASYPGGRVFAECSAFLASGTQNQSLSPPPAEAARDCKQFYDVFRDPQLAIPSPRYEKHLNPIARVYWASQRLDSGPEARILHYMLLAFMYCFPATTTSEAVV